ncbi:signal peptidase I [Rhodococcoides kroppenstedtii]|uniref:Signal peptidase I n=1 Tax=Rhodococcoides kroppenstedtii TaxID=293050 RepID=A0ABS7NVE5_9NOCA|nr:signal peptidase I [Rhodococcus kroppenstedtii]MBY6320887.1 signal peptidase I [Rhodococcus kroppenstedtii]
MPEPDSADTPASRPLPRPLDRALSVVAVLGALCVAFALCTTAFSLTPLVFRSGSMEPAIPTGSLAVAREVPASDVAEGDVVSVLRSDGSRITHRVARVESVFGDTATLILQGDANDAPDADPYVVADIDRVVGHVPVLGYAASWLATPVAWVIGALLAAGLVVLIVRPDAPRPSGSGGRHRIVATAGAAMVAVIVVPSVGRTDGTVAAMTDTAQVSAEIAAVTLPRPASFTCTDSSNGSNRVAQLSWSAPGNPYGYRLIYQPTSGTPRVQQVPAGTTTATPPAEVLALLQTFTVSLVTQSGTFVSAPALTRQISVTALGGLINTSRCVTAGTATAGPTAAARLAAPTSTSDPSAATSPTTPPATTPPASTSAAPTTTTQPTTTTPPPPPASAFVAEGGSSSSGGSTASVSGGTLTVTDATGATLLTRPVTTSARYGTGVVWSSTGDLYVLADSGVTRIVVGNGTASASAASTDSLPADIRALL